MKLIRYDGPGDPESWVQRDDCLDNCYFDAGGKYDTCHIERLDNGKYMLNDGGFFASAIFVGPEFDSPEEAALWVAMGGRVEE